MECKVLGVKQVSSGLRFAHIQVGQLFGELPCEEGIQADSMGFVKVTAVARNGRIEFKGKVVNPNVHNI